MTQLSLFEDFQDNADDFFHRPYALARSIRVVDNVPDLYDTPFGSAAVVVYPRQLAGDFNEMARALVKQIADRAQDRYQAGDYHSYMTQGQVLLTRKKIEDYTQHWLGMHAQAAAAVLDDMRMFERRSPANYINLQIIKNNPLQISAKAVDRFHTDPHGDLKFGQLRCCYNDVAIEGHANKFAENTNAHENFHAEQGHLWRHTGLSAPEDFRFHFRNLPFKENAAPRLMLVSY